MTRRDYFKIKEVSKWEGCSGALLNPEALKALREYALDYARWSVKGARLEAPQELKLTSVLTGFKVLSGDHNKPGNVNEFEFHPLAVANIYSSLGDRFFKAQCCPNDDERLARLSTSFMDTFMRDLKPELWEPQDPLAYSRDNFDSIAKTKAYFYGVQRAWLHRDYDRGAFKLMVKSGEVYYTTNQSEDPQTVLASERPRGIMVPESDGQKFSASLQTPIL